ncbi:MAG: threonylcarbamoyl-AMP synthase [Candidatus Omnitrophica bacterium]|nr:threonylcarbamoyl-AMP synthase [Candidatus Omnitrophota bacterium]
MEILKPTPQNVSKCAEMLRNGELVAFPTETVYGLGGNALNLKAVAKIFEVKKRPVFDPLIVHISDRKMLQQVVPGLSSAVRKLTEKFWPGPLTIVAEKAELIPDLVTAGMPTVAVRMPNHPVALSLIKRAKMPIAAPSANLFNRTSPTEASAVRQQLQGRVSAVLDGGKCRVGVESTIVKAQGKILSVLRPGAVTVEMLREVFDGKVISVRKPLKEIQPGGIEKHYAPETAAFLADKKLSDTESYILRKMKSSGKKPKLGLVGFGKIRSLTVWDRAVSLSEVKNLNEAAENLFSTMRWMDGLKLDGIVFKRIPEKSVGVAVMDRIRKACHGNNIEDLFK